MKGIFDYPFIDFAIDIVTLILISVLLLLSFISLSFILHLHFKSKNSQYLERFNALWRVRCLLVSFITLWAFNELLRLPLFRLRYLYPFLYSLSETSQINICKTHVVLSLGFFEPGFLVILLFLLNVSIKKKTPRGSWALVFLLAICIPIMFLQFLFVFVEKWDTMLNDFFKRCYTISRDRFGNKTVLCAYPLLNTIFFGAFSMVFSLYFLFSCWSVISIVINKTLRVRIYTLAVTVISMVAVQVLCLCISVFWLPEDVEFDFVALVIFLCTFMCAAVGEGIFVIIPITDSLAVGGNCCPWQQQSRWSGLEEQVSNEENV